VGENGYSVTDPLKDFVQFLKGITHAMVGNKRCEHGEILMKALSHFGTVRVPRDRVKQIFTGKRGKQYTVIREEFQLETEQGMHQRFAYRVSKDYGNIFYKDFTKMVLGNDFAEIMDYPDPTAEKCGDVVEMWLGMLDIANMTKSQITFMETKADPGELLAGLEASLNIFHGTTRSTTTSNTKRSGSRITEPMNHEEVVVNKILYDTPMWHSLQNLWPVRTTMMRWNWTVRASGQARRRPRNHRPQVRELMLKGQAHLRPRKCMMRHLILKKSSRSQKTRDQPSMPLMHTLRVGRRQQCLPEVRREWTSQL